VIESRFASREAMDQMVAMGMEEGMSIEDKRITKGIIRAQKKVEERNFLARKNLLEYDEVMDHQRTTFYGMRQRVLEGRGVDDIIWSMIGDSIKDAVDKYVVQDYIAATIAEWVRSEFNVMVEPSDLRGMRRLQDLEEYIKNQARAEASDNIQTTLQEYTGESEPPKSDLLKTPLKLERGYLVVPETPGLGIELNEAALTAHPVKDKVLGSAGNAVRVSASVPRIILPSRDTSEVLIHGY